MPRAHVLLVDDEPGVLRSTAALLEHLGFRVTTWSTSEGILDALLRERPDVLLQDVRMPGLDLDALVEAVRAERRLDGVRLVLFTASLEAGEVAGRVRADGVLDKPFRPDEVVGVIEAALAAPARA